MSNATRPLKAGSLIQDPGSKVQTPGSPYDSNALSKLFECRGGNPQRSSWADAGIGGQPPNAAAAPATERGGVTPQSTQQQHLGILDQVGLSLMAPQQQAWGFNPPSHPYRRSRQCCSNAMIRPCQWHGNGIPMASHGLMVIHLTRESEDGVKKMALSRWWETVETVRNDLKASPLPPAHPCQQSIADSLLAGTNHF